MASPGEHQDRWDARSRNEVVVRASPHRPPPTKGVPLDATPPKSRGAAQEEIPEPWKWASSLGSELLYWAVVSWLLRPSFLLRLGVLLPQVFLVLVH